MDLDDNLPKDLEIIVNELQWAWASWAGQSWIDLTCKRLEVEMVKIVKAMRVSFDNNEKDDIQMLESFENII